MNIQQAFDVFVRLVRNRVIAGERFNAYDIKVCKRITAEQAGLLNASDGPVVYLLMQRFTKELSMNGVHWPSVLPPVLQQQAAAPAVVRHSNRGIDWQGDSFIITFPYDAGIVAAVKKIPAKYLATAKCWRASIALAKQVHKFAQEHKFPISEIALQKITGLATNFRESYSSEYIELGLPLKKRLFPFQTQGIAYGLKNERVIFGDEPGLGKTVQGIGTVLGADAFPCLVICPKSLRLNWADEWHMWTDKKAVLLNDNTAAKFKYMNGLGWADVAITNYEGVRKYLIESETVGADEHIRYKLNALCGQFKSIIIDEAHELKNTKTKRYKQCKAVCRGKSHIMLLTGTPVVNDSGDLAALINILGRMDEFGGWPKFMEKYSGLTKAFIEKGESRGSNTGNLMELNEKMRNSFFIRREKHQVMKELPEKLRQVIRVDITNRPAYDHAFVNFQSYLINNGRSEAQVHKAMGAEVLTQMGVLKQIAARGKMEALIEFASEIITAGEKLIVFCWFLETYDALRKEYPQAVGITGRETDDQVQHNKNLFQNDPATNIIIVTYKRGGVGHTLTAASKVAFIELGWNPKDQNQAEDRAHRIGQKNTVNCYYFLGADTIDEHIYNIIGGKDSAAKVATGGTGEVKTEVHATKEFTSIIDSLRSKRPAAV